MDNQPQSSKSHLIIFVTAALAIIALVVLVIVISRNGSEPTETEGQDQTNQEAGDSGDQETEDGDAGQETSEEGADEETGHQEETTEAGEEDDGETVAQPEGQLPANWHELSSVEKTALNPFDCPEDRSGIVHLSAETGECLDYSTDQEDEDTDEDEDDNEDEDQDDGRVSLPTDATTVNFSETFPYGNDLELVVTGLSCSNLTVVSIETSHQTDQILTLGQVLDDFTADWEFYKSDPESWAEFHFELNYDAADNQIYYTGFLPYLEDNYKYLLNFEKWLQANGADPTVDLSEQLFNYLDCRILVSLTNTGPARQLASDCPSWEFRTTMELIGNKRDYGQNHRVLLEPRPADCTDDLVDFLTGEVVESGFTPFIINSDDEIREIIIRDGVRTFQIVRN